MFATVFCGSIFAQEQGGMFISGDIGMNFNSLSMSDFEYDPLPEGLKYNEDNVVKQSELSLNLSGAYFIMDGLAVGLSVSMDQEKTTANEHLLMIPDGYTASSTANEEAITTETTTMFGPMVRYYIGETGVFANLSYMMGGSKTVKNANASSVTNNANTSIESTDNTKKSRLGIGVGYAIGLADNVSLTPMFEYHMDSWTVENDATSEGGDFTNITSDTSGNPVYHNGKIKAGGMSFSVGLTIMM